MFERLLVNLVPELVAAVQHGNLAQLLTDYGQGLFVSGGVAPQRDAQMLVSNAENHAVDHVAFLLLEHAARHVQQKLQPGLVDLFLHVVLDWQRHDPLASVAVSRVLPLGPDALLKDQVVSIGNDFSDGVGVVVHLPEILDRAKRKHLVENVLVVARVLLVHALLLTMRLGVHIPERPFIDQLVQLSLRFASSIRGFELVK